MSRWLVRGVFAAAIIGLPLQVAVRELKSEPYPGLCQPSFGGEVTAGPTYEVLEPRVTVTEADGGVHRIAYQRLMPPTRFIPSAIFSSAFRSEQRSGDPRTTEWLRQRIGELEPGNEPTTVTISGPNQFKALAVSALRRLQASPSIVRAFFADLDLAYISAAA